MYFCTHSFNKQQMGKNNQVILLTGASSGIGYDTAAALAKQGHKVYAAARRIAESAVIRLRRRRKAGTCLAWRHTEMPLIDTAEMLRIAEPERVGDFSHRMSAG